MDNVNKAIIVPLVSSLLIMIKSLFHIEFDAETSNAILVFILCVVSIIGIFMHPKKPEPPQQILIPVQQQVQVPTEIVEPLS